ncbi:MAG: RluA family pseudouridine synthase [bacterium]|nr:RluA family pseudouridine synthase [bacterium]
MIPIEITTANEGIRLDALIASYYPHLSRATIKRFIDQGNILRSDGKKCTKGDKISLLYTYMLTKEPVEQTLQPNPDIPLHILYEDEALLAINKPAAINCQPNKIDETDTLANALLNYCSPLEGVGDSPLTCGILHRIDFDTSGLILVAKNQSIYNQLREQFAAHTVEKHYAALVTGRITTPTKLEHYLAHNPRCPGRMVDASQWHDVKRPMYAATAYEPRWQRQLQNHPVSLLDVTIFTGVTHQIRAQLSLAGYPIVGDKQYGGLQIEGFPRHFLHAASAQFIHPLTQRSMTLQAPLQKDLTKLLSKIK